MFIELQKSHPNNGTKRLTICKNGNKLKKGRIEAVVINLRPLNKTLWIWHSKDVRNSFPCCG